MYIRSKLAICPVLFDISVYHQHGGDDYYCAYTILVSTTSKLRGFSSRHRASISRKQADFENVDVTVVDNTSHEF